MLPPARDQPDTRSLIQKTRQDGNITGLNFLAQTVLLEWMSADPVTRHNLLQTCRYYRAFVMPIMGETHFIEPALRKDLLISIIAGQTGDVALFFRDRQLQALRFLSIPEIKDVITTGYYTGTLSATTAHGKMYRSIGPGNIKDCNSGEKDLGLRDKALRLVPLNFSGAEGITQLDLCNNELKAVDLSHNTALNWFNLSNNQLKAVDLSQNTALNCLFLNTNQLATVDLSQQTALELLGLSDNQFTAVDLSQQTALGSLNLCGNQLTTVDLSQQTALNDLYLCDNQLATLDLPQPTALNLLDLTNNQLTALDLSQQTALQGLVLYGNPLTALDISQQTALQGLCLDAEVFRNESVLATLRALNAQRNADTKINLIAYSKDANGQTITQNITGLVS